MAGSSPVHLAQRQELSPPRGEPSLGPTAMPASLPVLSVKRQAELCRGSSTVRLQSSWPMKNQVVFPPDTCGFLWAVHNCCVTCCHGNFRLAGRLHLNVQLMQLPEDHKGEQNKFPIPLSLLSRHPNGCQRLRRSVALTFCNFR